jgi:exosortase/archaeosortase family protein
MRRQKKTAGLSWASLKNEWRGWYLEKAPVLSFGLKFGLLILLLYLLLDLPAGDRLLYVYLEANAWLAHSLLNLFGQHSQLTEGVVIRSSQFSMAIRRGCDAVEPTWLVCAAMIAFPAPLSKKLGGILAATLALQTLNIVRLLTLYWIGVHWPSFFNSAHMELWPTIFILVAIVLFLLWKGVTLDQGHRTRA